MRPTLTAIALLFATAVAIGAPPEKVTVDLLRFTPPLGWKVETKQNTYTSYTTVNKPKGEYCQIFVFLSLASLGDLGKDFDREWQNVIVKPYSVTAAPHLTETREANGYEARAGVVPFEFNHQTAVAILFTLRGFDRVTSIVAVTNNAEAYMPAIQNVLASVEITKPATVATSTAKASPTTTAKPAALQGYMDYSPFTKTWTWRLRTPPQ
jgi:hypothetical protein